jgi:hypothetical protein
MMVAWVSCVARQNWLDQTTEESTIDDVNNNAAAVRSAQTVNAPLCETRQAAHSPQDPREEASTE